MHDNSRAGFTPAIVLSLLWLGIGTAQAADNCKLGKYWVKKSGENQWQTIFKNTGAADEVFGNFAVCGTGGGGAPLLATQTITITELPGKPGEPGKTTFKIDRDWSSDGNKCKFDGDITDNGDGTKKASGGKEKCTKWTGEGGLKGVGIDFEAEIHCTGEPKKEQWVCDEKAYEGHF